MAFQAQPRAHAHAHAIILPFPTQGHIIPALKFAETLTSQGFIITFVCAEHRIARIRKSHASGLSPRIRLIGLPDEVPVAEQDVDQGSDSLLLAIRIAENMAPAFEQTVNGLIEDAQKESSIPPPLCIISDFYVSWSQDTANKFKIPRYVFYPSPCSCLALMLYLPHLIEQGIVPLAPDARDIVIPGLPPMDGSDMPESWKQNSFMKERRDFSFRNLFKLHESSGILVNTFYELEGEAIDAASTEAINPNKVPIYALGPILPSKFFRGEPIDQQAFIQTDNECLQWLNAQAPSSVLFISFGSIAILSIRQIQEIAKALDACQQAFLWILRLPTSATDQSTLFPEGFLSRTHNRGLIISTWAPQLLILSHPSTGGFMSHCGWNSTLESISSGVPILPLPLFAEQHMNSRMVINQFKVGVKLQRGADGVAENENVEIAVMELMQGEEGRAARRRARALKEQAARAVSEAGSSHKALDAFIQAATITHTQT
ncbi:hypothetical protein O6H91_06G142500 [Diphasiastrum complanatum]|uniref:Uncharacterized protein n=3 Tax=Diphasiastrum complanatum TaxID=34168 RepID=A0ACC2DKF8_DIPCM|nr:hypothetical protein O6H91_06G142500 [Diphasiastrum complanatum]KAJ7554478.1 hypothetical protein O6H91_06G142500 [Diphasiastrum complanatum]KAJ7554479.1 hypothetical protein O6H91_06G142500 [Diphasiastrum complanatum]